MPFTLVDRPLVRTSPRTMLSGPPNVFAFLLRGPASCVRGGLFRIHGACRPAQFPPTRIVLGTGDRRDPRIEHLVRRRTERSSRPIEAASPPGTMRGERAFDLQCRISSFPFDSPGFPANCGLNVAPLRLSRTGFHPLSPRLRLTRRSPRAKGRLHGATRPGRVTLLPSGSRAP
jgi:hypothetical protein